MSSEDLNREILQLYDYIKKSKAPDPDPDPDRYIDRYIDTDTAKQHMQEILKQGIVTIKNRHTKIKHKYKIRHRIL
jgi:hypothetical protein